MAVSELAYRTSTRALAAAAHGRAGIAGAGEEIVEPAAHGRDRERRVGARTVSELGEILVPTPTRGDTSGEEGAGMESSERHLGDLPALRACIVGRSQIIVAVDTDQSSARCERRDDECRREEEERSRYPHGPRLVPLRVATFPHANLDPVMTAAHVKPIVVGRYAVFDRIASGGMATVHFGRLLGPVGFSRTVAIKRLHPQFAKDPEFVAMFLDEARLAARIRHPNVVPTLDVVAHARRALPRHGVRAGRVARASAPCVARNAASACPPRASRRRSCCGALHGLHAAHEAKNERGEPLGIVHRDVSPQNVLVGVDGVARVLDFGVAKARGRMQTTREGQLKGKLAYMAPEQLRGQPATQQSDVYAAAVVLWEALTRGDCSPPRATGSRPKDLAPSSSHRARSRPTSRPRSTRS